MSEESRVDITRDQAMENLQRLHERYQDQWYGLDNACDDEIIDCLLGLEKS